MTEAVPAVSVVLSVFNGMPFLPTALDSILGQTFDDLEIVVVDDGSTDGSAALLADVASRDERVRVLTQTNHGLITSLNRGIAVSRAPLVARMDADDIAHPTRLARQVAELEARPEVGILGTVAEYVDEDGRPLGSTWPKWRPSTSMHWHGLFQTVLCHPTVVMRRSVLDALDDGAGPYRTTALHAEDYELWTRAMFVTTLANLDEALLQRRKWPGTVGELHAERQEQSVLDAMRAAQERLLGRPLNPTVVEILRAAATSRRLDAPLRAMTADERHDAADVLIGLRDAFVAAGGLDGSERDTVDADVGAMLRAMARAPGRARGLGSIAPRLGLLARSARIDAAGTRDAGRTLLRHGAGRLVRAGRRRLGTDAPADPVPAARPEIAESDPAPDLAALFGPAPDPDPERSASCVLVITYARSGSTLLTGILNSIDGYLIRGENGNAFLHLARMVDAFGAAEQRSRPRVTHPWFNDVDWNEARRRLVDIGRATICGDGAARVYGFKEIRYVPGSPEVGLRQFENSVVGLRDFDEFERYLDFLRIVFPDCRFVFNTRGIADTVRSGWWPMVPDAAERLATAESWYERYRHSHDGCFHITYEDLVAAGPQVERLFDFLGEPYDPAIVAATLDRQHSFRPKAP